MGRCRLIRRGLALGNSAMRAWSGQDAGESGARQHQRVESRGLPFDDSQHCINSQLFYSSSRNSGGSAQSLRGMAQRRIRATVATRVSTRIARARATEDKRRELRWRIELTSRRVGARFRLFSWERSAGAERSIK